MSIASQISPPKKPYKLVLGIWAFWSVVAAVGSDRATDWITIVGAGLLATLLTLLVLAIMLRLLGVGGFLFTTAATLVVGLWKIAGPFPAIIITSGAAYLLWRFRFDIAKRFGVQPERAASADTSSAAASSQDSSSGTSI